MRVSRYAIDKHISSDRHADLDINLKNQTTGPTGPKALSRASVTHSLFVLVLSLQLYVECRETEFPGIPGRYS